MTTATLYCVGHWSEQGFSQEFGVFLSNGPSRWAADAPSVQLVVFQCLTSIAKRNDILIHIVQQTMKFEFQKKMSAAICLTCNWQKKRDKRLCVDNWPADIDFFGWLVLKVTTVHGQQRSFAECAQKLRNTNQCQQSTFIPNHSVLLVVCSSLNPKVARFIRWRQCNTM